MIHLANIDILIIIAYFMGVIGIGIFTSRYAKNMESFLLMGRKLTLPLFVGTLVSTWYGGITGVGEISYSSGLYNWLTQGIFWYLSYLVFALFLAARLQKSKAFTLPDQLDFFYGKTARKIGLVFNFFNVVPIAYVISLGVMIQAIFHLPLPISIIIGGLFSMTYTLLGGFAADVYTDFIQFVVMCIGVSLLIFFSFFKLGGWEYLTTHVPPSHLTLSGGMPFSEILIWGFIAMTTLVDPNFYQRCYAAEKPEVAKKGILLSIIFWMLFDICTTFAGIYARARFSDIDPKFAYLHLADEVLPPVFKGIYIAAMLATIMSTVDSYFFVAATTISRDLYQKVFRPNASEKQIVWITRCANVFTGLLTIVMALGLYQSIKTIWKLFGSISGAGLLVPLMIGFWYSGPKKHSAGVAAMVFGLLTAAFFYTGNKFFHIPWCSAIEPLYPGMAASFLAFCLFNRGAK